MKHKKPFEINIIDKKFEGFLEFSPDAVMIINSDGRIVLVNSMTEKMFGYHRDELLGKPVEILLPERFREKHVGHRKDYYSEPRMRSMGVGLNLFGRRKDGTEFPVEISLSPMGTENGVHAISFIRDVAEHKRVEEALRIARDELEKRVGERTAELLRAMGILEENIAKRERAEKTLRAERDKAQRYLDVAGVIIVVIDADQKVSLINKKGCEILGYEEKEIIGKNWFDRFVPERTRDVIKVTFLKLIAGEIKPVEYFQNPVLTKSGEERIIAWHNAVLRDEDDRIYATLSSGLDITEKAELEQQVRQTEKLAAVGQLTTALAHEIGTPLNVIMGRAEYMLRKISSEDPLRENLERIIGQIERITRLVQQLLSFTRTKPLEIRSLRLGSLLQGILLLFEYQLEQQGITVSLDCSNNLPEIWADSDQIQQVCFNIILNAIQAMPHEGNLAIRASRTLARTNREDPIKDQYIKIEIADTGIGIEADKLSKIFDPFFSTKEAGKGTGLGLTVCYSIMRSHGGWIDAKSQAGKGSVFTIYLPLKPAPRMEKILEGLETHG